MDSETPGQRDPSKGTSPPLGRLVQADENCWRCSGPVGENRTRDGVADLGDDEVCQQQQGDDGNIVSAVDSVLEKETHRAPCGIVSARRPDCVTEQESEGEQKKRRHEAYELRLIRMVNRRHESTLSVQGELVKVGPR